MDFLQITNKCISSHVTMATDLHCSPSLHLIVNKFNGVRIKFLTKSAVLTRRRTTRFTRDARQCQKMYSSSRKLDEKCGQNTTISSPVNVTSIIMFLCYYKIVLLSLPAFIWNRKYLQYNRKILNFSSPPKRFKSDRVHVTSYVRRFCRLTARPFPHRSEWNQQILKYFFE